MTDRAANSPPHASWMSPDYRPANLAIMGAVALIAATSSLPMVWKTPPAPTHQTSSVASPTDKPRLLEFMSPHCAACARMGPVLAEVQRRCAATEGTVVRVDVEDLAGAALASRYDVQAVPTFVGVNALARETHRMVGEQPSDRLALLLADVRGQACDKL